MSASTGLCRIGLLAPDHCDRRLTACRPRREALWLARNRSYAQIVLRDLSYLGRLQSAFGAARLTDVAPGRSRSGCSAVHGVALTAVVPGADNQPDTREHLGRPARVRAPCDRAGRGREVSGAEAPAGAAVLAGPGIPAVRSARWINAVLAAVRGMIVQAVAEGGAPGHLVQVLYEVTDDRDLPVAARGEDGGAGCGAARCSGCAVVMSTCWLIPGSWAAGSPARTCTWCGGRTT